MEGKVRNADEKIKIVPPSDPLVSVSNLGPDFSLIRFAADSTEDAYKLLSDILKPLCTGDLKDLPKPYSDRIHCLNSEDLTTDSTIKKNLTTDSTITVTDDELLSNELLSNEENKDLHDMDTIPNDDAHSTLNPKYLGSAALAMKNYDEKISTIGNL